MFECDEVFGSGEKIESGGEFPESGGEFPESGEEPRSEEERNDESSKRSRNGGKIGSLSERRMLGWEWTEVECAGLFDVAAAVSAVVGTPAVVAGYPM